MATPVLPVAAFASRHDRRWYTASTGSGQPVYLNGGAALRRILAARQYSAAGESQNDVSRCWAKDDAPGAEVVTGRNDLAGH